MAAVADAGGGRRSIMYVPNITYPIGRPPYVSFVVCLLDKGFS